MHSEADGSHEEPVHPHLHTVEELRALRAKAGRITRELDEIHRQIELLQRHVDEHNRRRQ